jgi:hypothetical protein
MRKLLVLVVLLLVILAGTDIATRIAMEHQLQQRIGTYAANADPKVTIHGFPWLPTLIGSGRVARITAHAGPVSQDGFVFDRVDITVTGVRIDRTLLLHQRQLEIVSIDTGTVTADMTQADLDRLLGVPVVLGNGSAQATVDGVSVSAQVSVSNGQLHLVAVGLPVSIPIPTIPILPCLAKVTIVPGHLIGSCTFHQIPPALKTALQ